ncbi:MAG: dihydroxy-acid dehydratase, partial [Spirochaetales bacterium]|nr:dihydroxy-acid dehydratase [Spirochaetales bacterium]
MKEKKLRSSVVTQGVERAPHRSLLYALGWSKDMFRKPIIGIANSFTELIPGHINLREIAERVKEGISSAGGVPAEFGTIGICDGLAMGHFGMKFSLPSRELIADSVEVVARGNALDGIVLITNCDKIDPGMMMAAGRLDIPAIIISGGPMLSGKINDKNIGLDAVFEAVGEYTAGKISKEQLEQIECSACPGAGSCSGLFTANSMNCMAEALGIALPGNGTVPAVFGERLQLAEKAGQKIVEAVKSDLTARKILTRKAFLNAVAVDMALGGSTNTALHLPAIAASAGVSLTLEDFDRISEKVPHLCALAPSGPYFMEHLNSAGGVMAVINQIDKLGVIDGHVPTISGKKLRDSFKDSPKPDGKIIATLEKPYHSEGGLAVLKGNLAPGGSIVKKGAVDPSMLVHTGPARVFESEEEAQEAIL